MPGPIYKFFRVRFTEAYYQLSPEERAALMARSEGISAQHGVKLHVLCDSNWSNEQWTGFGLEEFPDLETLQQHNTALAAIDWFRYLECETMLGTAYTAGA